MSSSNDNLLPVFFFHGLTRNASDGDNLKDAITAQGRGFVALSFASGDKSSMALHKQLPLAIEQIRSVVASDERFQNGYVLMGHSMGGLLARAVVEEMDDHKVHTLITVASPHNGLFYGPQSEDQLPFSYLLSPIGTYMLRGSNISFEKYRGDATIGRGKVQLEFATLMVEQPELQEENSFLNIQRIPSANDWLRTHSFIPKMNNVNNCESDEEVLDQQRRKRNFLKLKAAHFFGSSGDGAAIPWQTSLFGRYNDVDSLEEIESKFEDLNIVKMSATTEYKDDTFGLKTLHERGGLFLHEVPDVPHSGWLMNSPLVRDLSKVCAFKTVFDEHINPALP